MISSSLSLASSGIVSKASLLFIASSVSCYVIISISMEAAAYITLVEIYFPFIADSKSSLVASLPMVKPSSSTERNSY